MSAVPTSPENTALGRYTSLEGGRQSVLDRARSAAKLTIPSLLPPSGHNETSSLPTPFQAVGARGVNNLAAKLLLAILPSTTSFVKLQVDDASARELDEAGEHTRGAMDAVFASLERTIMGEVDASHLRVPAFEMLKHLIVTGNSLCFFPPDGGMRTFPLDRYVVVRSPMGQVVEIIVKESIAPAALPPELMEMACAGSEGDDKKADPTRSVDIYTHIRWTGRRWGIRQELKGQTVPGSIGHYPKDHCPWFALRMIRVDGESYGRGIVEEHIGDLISLEGLTQAIVEGSLAAAKVLFLIKPNGTTRAKVVSSAPNGAVVQGSADDVSVLGLEKYNDFRVALETIDRIEKRLEYAFLLTSSIQRKAERVTAEEIRLVAQDLESALGGVYALLTQEFQIPLVKLLMKRLQSQGRFPKLPEGKVRPTIVGGMEALGRGNDLANLAGLMNDLVPFMKVLEPRLNPDEIVKRFAAARGVPMKDLLRPADQVAQEGQQAMMNQTLQNVAPDAVKAILPKIMEGMGGQPGEPNGASTPSAA